MLNFFGIIGRGGEDMIGMPALIEYDDFEDNVRFVDS